MSGEGWNIRSAAAVFGVLVTLCSAPAADYNWRNVKVGGGGYSPAVVFSPVERGLAYLRTDIGGAYRWDSKSATWIPLQDRLGDGNLFGIESVAPDPTDPDTVYAAAGMYRDHEAAILRSSDRGATWDIVKVPFRMGGNDIGRAAGERLAVDPNDPSVLYFGSRYDGLQRSTDEGRTWSKVAAFPLPGTGLAKTASGDVDWSRPASFGISFVIFDPASGTKAALRAPSSSVRPTKARAISSVPMTGARPGRTCRASRATTFFP